MELNLQPHTGRNGALSPSKLSTGGHHHDNHLGVHWSRFDSCPLKPHNKFSVVRLVKQGIRRGKKNPFLKFCLDLLSKTLKYDRCNLRNLMPAPSQLSTWDFFLAQPAYHSRKEDTTAVVSFHGKAVTQRNGVAGHPHLILKKNPRSGAQESTKAHTE